MKEGSGISSAMVYRIGLVLFTALPWILLYRAKYLEYDDDVAAILAGFALSVLEFILLCVALFRFRSVVMDNKAITLAALVLSSPLTIVLVIFNYSKIFGAFEY